MAALQRDRADHARRGHHRVLRRADAGSHPEGIASGADGNLWFTDLGTTSAIGRIGTGAQAQPPIPTVAKLTPATGPVGGGTKVTITGTDLTGASAVKFGATNATNITVVSETTITAVSPAESAETVHVTVTTPEGTTETGVADQFTYSAAPTVVTKAPSSITQTTAKLNATVNPNGSEVSKCTFEYGTTTAYGSSAACTSLPGLGAQPGGGLGADQRPDPRTPPTTSGYRRRTRAATSNGSDVVFTTLPNANTPHWYKNGAIAKEGAKVPVIGWGTLTLTSSAGALTCHTVIGGYVENPVGGGPGLGVTQSFNAYECSAAECPTESRLEAYDMPWGSELEEATPPVVRSQNPRRRTGHGVLVGGSHRPREPEHLRTRNTDRRPCSHSPENGRRSSEKAPPQQSPPASNSARGRANSQTRRLGFRKPGAAPRSWASTNRKLISHEHAVGHNANQAHAGR